MVAQGSGIVRFKFANLVATEPVTSIPLHILPSIHLYRLLDLVQLTTSKIQQESLIILASKTQNNLLQDGPKEKRST
jgi:hypothetical protein